MPGLVPGIHVFSCAKQGKTWMAGTSPAMTATNAFSAVPHKPGHDGAPSVAGACFPALLAPNKGREIGGGRATRQPGQVRKEAALTRFGSGRSSVSYLFSSESRRIAALPPRRRVSLLPQ